MHRKVAIGMAVFALGAVACSSSEDDNAAPDTSPSTAEAPAATDAPADTAAPATEAPPVATEAPAPETTAAPAVELPDYFAIAAEVEQAADARSLPPEQPETATGSYGYSRYVYANSNGEVVPSLIEGPLGRQVRCQDAERNCSYQELKALYESGEEVPDYLSMDRDTLGELVGQLDRVNAAVMSYETIDEACAAGFVKSTNQNANMGIHMIDPSAGSAATGGEFNPDKPQMVLFAKEDGFGVDASQLGTCDGDTWTGEPGFEPVGAVFNLNLNEEHPEGFAGDIDNWHIHYNTCIARNRNAAIEGADMGEGGSVTQEQCTNAGGAFLPLIPSWMMHAYVADDFEAQSGVFSMFNPSIWPLTDPESLEANRVQRSGEADIDAPINNFDFGTIQASVGETIRFSNSDALPHTVTAGTASAPGPLFDSGVLGTGQSFDLSFDEAGSYELFCVLHPDMTAVVEVD